MGKLTKKPSSTTENSSGFSLSNLAKKLSVFNVDAGVLSDNIEKYTIDDWISTGSYIFNAQISGDIEKGIPAGRVTILSGLKSSGKTFSCLNVVRNAIKKGYQAVWIDSESAVDTKLFENFDIPLDKIIVVPVDTVANTSTYLLNLFNEIKQSRDSGIDTGKFIVVLDSLGNLSTDKEMTDVASGSDKKDMTRASSIKAMFRVVSRHIGMLKIPMIVTNHVYANVGNFIGGTTMGGGEGPAYNASVTVEFSKAQLKDVATAPQTGVIITSKVRKSRFTKEGIPIKMFLRYVGGINKYVGLEEYLNWDEFGIAPGKFEKGQFVLSDSSRTIAVKHLNDHVAKKNFYTKEVFTPEILEKINIKLKEIFMLPAKSEDDNYNIEDFIDEPNVDIETGEIIE